MLAQCVMVMVRDVAVWCFCTASDKRPWRGQPFLHSIVIGLVDTINGKPLLAKLTSIDIKSNLSDKKILLMIYLKPKLSSKCKSNQSKRKSLTIKGESCARLSPVISIASPLLQRSNLVPMIIHSYGPKYQEGGELSAPKDRRYLQHGAGFDG